MSLDTNNFYVILVFKLKTINNFSSYWMAYTNKNNVTALSHTNADKRTWALIRDFPVL